MRAILIVAAGRVMQLMAALIALKLSTTLLVPAELGQINQMAAVGALFASGVVLPVVVYFARGIVGWAAAGQFTQRLVQALAVFASLAAVLTVIGTGIQSAWTPVHGITLLWFAVLLAVYVFGFPTYTLMINCVSVMGQRGRSSGYANLAAWSGLGLAIALYLEFSDPWYWLLGTFAGYLLAAQALWIVRPAPHAQPATPTATLAPLPFSLGPVFAFAWPQVIIFAFWWTQSQSYRFILAEVSTVAAVGLFFAGYTLVSVPMQAFEGAFNEVYSPTLYRNFESGGAPAASQAWNRYASAYMPSIILFGCCLAGCAPHFARLALGPEFQVATAFLLWPALAETARALSSVIHTLGIAKVDMRILLPPTALGAIAAPAFILLLAPTSPLMGTGMALCLASCCVLVAVYVLTRFAAPVVWPWRRMGLAALAGFPMLAIGLWESPVATETIVFALFACALLGLYAIACLYFFARPWLGELRRTQ